MSHAHRDIDSRRAAGAAIVALAAALVALPAPSLATARASSGPVGASVSVFPRASPGFHPPAARPAAAPASPTTAPYFDAADGAATAAATTVGTPLQRAARTRLADQLGPEAIVRVDAGTGTVSALQRLDGALSDPAEGSPETVARGYLSAHHDALGLTQADVDALVAEPAEITSGLSVVRLDEAVGGIPTWDSGLKVALDRGNRVLSVTGTPLSGLALPDLVPTLGAAAAIRALTGTDPGAAGPATGARRRTSFPGGASAELVIFTGAGAPRLAWHVLAPTAAGLADAAVDASSGAILVRQSLTKYDSGPFYPDYPGAEQDPNAAKASANALRNVDFQSAGWLPAGATTLSGNRVHAYSDLNDNDLVDSGEEVAPNSGADFRYPLTSFGAPAGSPKACGQSTSLADPTGVCTWDPNQAGSWQVNRAQDATQAFYLANTYAAHLAADPIDFPGFSGSSALILETDDGATTNTAGNGPNTAHTNNENMSTPPTGSPRLQTYLHRYRSTATLAYRNVNGGDNAATLWHEFTHGLSSRLVTYSDGSAALSSAQGGALGEAWSDWYAMDEITRLGLEVDGSEAGDVVFGGPVEADPGALRTEGLDCLPNQGTPRCPGTSTTHPGGYTYADFGKVIGRPEVHADGEIFAQALWDLRTRLISRSESLVEGSTLAEQLVTDAMRITPAEPTFLDARNALLAAATAVNPDLRTLVWQVMAAHGMGYYASSLDGTDTTPSSDFSLPPADDAATGRVAGTVTDKATGLGLAGVHVTFAGLSGNQPYDGQDETTTTAADGSWHLDVPPGTYGALSFGGVAGLTQGVQRNVTVTAGQTSTLTQTLQKDFATSALGAAITPTPSQAPEFAPDDSAAGFGCGAAQLLDESGQTGWAPYSAASTSSGSTHQGTPPAATVRLRQPIELTGLAINPSPVCGDGAAAGLKDFEIQAAGADGLFETVATGTFSSTDAGAPRTVGITDAPSGPITQVRLISLSSLGTSDYVDVADLQVYGAVPNQLPSGRLVATPASVAPGGSVTLDASSFTDPDSAITGYDWDLDGNGTIDRSTSGPSTVATYATVGTFTPHVYVRDFRGGSGTATSTVGVAVPPPTPTATSTTPAPPTPTSPQPGATPPATITGSGTPVPPPRNVTPEDPVLETLAGAAKGRATVSVRCPAVCTLAANATLPAATAKRLRRRSRVALSARRTLKAGANTTTLSLTSAVLGSARRKGLRTLRVTFKLAVTTAAGGSATATRALSLRLR